MNKVAKVAISVSIGFVLLLVLAYAVLMALVLPRTVPSDVQSEHKQLAQSIFQEEGSQITNNLGWNLERKEIEGYCDQYGGARNFYKCNFEQVVLFSLSGDPLNYMQRISKSVYDAGWKPDPGNERFFSTFQEYYINKNPESYHPLEGGGTYGENKSYEGGEPSHLSYDKLGVLLGVDVRIISGDKVEPTEGSETAGYTEQFEDQIKGIQRDSYKIKLTLEYRYTGRR